MEILIAGRGTRSLPIGCDQSSDLSPALQGAGAGGIQNVSLIIVADLIPLRERGFFVGINNAYVIPLM